jgi:hypothetical protein
MIEGCDPTASVGAVYKQIGEYHEIGLGARDETISANVLETENGAYAWKTLHVRNIDTFLSDILHPNTLIDYLWIDIEGPEYQIFTRSGPVSIDFCVII